MRGNVCGVLAHTKQDSGLATVEEVHAQEIEPPEPGDAALLHREPPGIQHWQVDPAVVKAVAVGSYHAPDPSSLEVKGRGSIATGVRTGLVERVRLRSWGT